MNENINNENSGTLSIKEMKGAENLTFSIPFYQRGYRWTSDNVKKLLDDLVEFVGQQEGSYCLQPIVLQKLDENKYRVVDGQQRLTTIALIMSVFNEPETPRSWKITYDAENGKELQDLIDKTGLNSINDYFRKNALETIKTFKKDTFEKGNEKQKEQYKSIKDLFEGHSSKDIYFIKYFVKDDKDGYDAFQRLNAGKTPLTSSELIRALYMVGSSGLSEQDKMEVSKEWELIETTLRNEQFWFMFNAKGLHDTATRIDLLFALVLSTYYGQQNSEKEFKLEDIKANPRIVFDRLDEKQIDLKSLWDEILRCFWWMQSCYSDTELFNYLGWIREFTDVSAKSIYNDWLNNQKIEDFKQCVKDLVREKFKNIQFEEIAYQSMKADELRKIFVLFNIFECNNTDVKFRFDLYSEGEWDIEHIDSQTPNQLNNDKEKQNWLYYAYKEINSKELENNSGELWERIKEEHKKICQENKLEWNNLDKFIHENISMEGLDDKTKYIFDLLQTTKENIENEHQIGNLALLNMNINRSYKNAIFPQKRRIIRDCINSGKYYIPPCTQRAFMKFYTTSSSKILCWTNSDFEDYSAVLKKWFDNFIKYEDIDNPNNTQYKLQLFKKPQENRRQKANTQDPNLANISSLISINEKCNFIDFINKYNIIIPKIQRLYVQGRLDKKGLKCLNEFAIVLVNSVVKSEPCVLDLVYGIESEDKSSFYPLDGQQRLTTLLLLSWLCFKHINIDINQNKEDDKNKKHFNYQSRRSNEFFIEKLLETDPRSFLDYKKPDGYDDKLEGKNYLDTCSKAIKKSDWFLPIWEKDPGISGMLEMLDSLYDKILNIGSEKLISLHNNDVKIGKLFDFSNIKFYVTYLNTKDKLYDHIFLKMNSRGKELSTWDNVKAILDLTAPEGCEWKLKIQNWYEKMWILFSKDNNSPNIEDGDNKMTHIVKIEDVDNKMIDIVNLSLKCYGFDKGAEQTFALEDWLSGDKSEEGKIETIKAFYDTCGHFYECLFEEHNIETFPEWAKQYAIDVTSNTTVKDFYRPLLAFYAQKLSDNKKWLRFSLNMIENTVDQESSFISLFKLLRNVSVANDFDGGNGIYNVLSTELFKQPSEQLQEEIAKAKQILNPKDGSVLPALPEDWKPSEKWDWKAAIIEAEKTAFFKGAIRFLFTDEDGNNDWGNFAEKWEKAQSYYDENGLNSEWQDVRLLKAMISRQTNFSTMWHWHTIFNNTKENWRSLLLNKQWQGPVHHILMGEVNVIDNSDSNIARLLEKDFLEHIIKEQPKAWIRNYGNFHAIWTSGKPRDRIVLNDILHKMASSASPKISYMNPIGESGYANGAGEGGCIDFIYRNHHFRWQDTDWVDMYYNNENIRDKGNLEEMKKLHTHFGKIEDGKPYFTKAVSLKDELDRCIDMYEELKKNGKI